MRRPTQVLLVSGSLRRGSTNTAALLTAAALAPPHISTRFYDDLGALPHFNPDDDREPLDPVVGRLRRSIADADAVLFSTPEYAGALPGSFKNLLDWVVGGGELHDKPVAWVNVSSSPAGAVDAHESLRTIFRFLGPVIIEDACAVIPVLRRDIGDDGLVEDHNTRVALASSLAALATFGPSAS